MTMIFILSLPLVIGYCIYRLIKMAARRATYFVVGVAGEAIADTKEAKADGSWKIWAFVFAVLLLLNYVELTARKEAVFVSGPPAYNLGPYTPGPLDDILGPRRAAAPSDPLDDILGPIHR